MLTRNRGRIVNLSLSDININDVMGVDVTLTVQYTPADPGVYRYPDGSGCPPTGDDAEVLEVVVNTVVGETYEFDRTERADDGWFKVLDEFALRVVEDLDVLQLTRERLDKED